jgi:hypothetical protein
MLMYYKGEDKFINHWGYFNKQWKTLENQK